MCDLMLPAGWEMEPIFSVILNGITGPVVIKRGPVGLLKAKPEQRCFMLHVRGGGLPYGGGFGVLALPFGTPPSLRL